MTRKSSNRSRGRKARSGKSASSSKLQIWLGRIWSIGWKLALTLAAVLVFIGIYLDSMIKQRFEGQLFDLPTVVYARILTLEPGNGLSLQELRNELDVLNYRKVAQPRFPVNTRLLPVELS